MAIFRTTQRIKKCSVLKEVIIICATASVSSFSYVSGSVRSSNLHKIEIIFPRETLTLSFHHKKVWSVYLKFNSSALSVQQKSLNNKDD